MSTFDRRSISILLKNSSPNLTNLEIKYLKIIFKNLQEINKELVWLIFWYCNIYIKNYLRMYYLKIQKKFIMHEYYDAIALKR